MAKKFKTGTLVKKTSKFLRSIGSVTRGPIDGIVLGSSGSRVLVAWSDGYTYQIDSANVQKTKKQMDAASAKATVTAEREAAAEKMDTETWTPSEIRQVVESYKRDDLAKGNPKSKRGGRKKSNPPPATHSRPGQMAYGVYNPHGKEDFYLDINAALARTAFLSGVNNGEPVKMRMYEADDEGGWLWSHMFSVRTTREHYELPSGARAANPTADVLFDQNENALVPNPNIHLSPAQLHTVMTLVKEHRSSGAYGSSMESWGELDDSLTNQARVWAMGEKERRKIKNRLLK